MWPPRNIYKCLMYKAHGNARKLMTFLAAGIWAFGYSAWVAGATETHCSSDFTQRSVGALSASMSRAST